MEKVAAKENINLVFIGHVDAGKSTISGHILCETGMVDDRTLQKLEKEAKSLNRESWAYAFVTDTAEEERERGKTVTCGRSYFETEHRGFTLMDAPGHSLFITSMISGAAQADLGILVISARKGEFEAGFERGGQTREHAMVAKTCGITNLIVVINKMDDITVGWDKTRYNFILSKLTPFLAGNGFRSKDVVFMPISGLTGAGLRERVPKSVCDWYDGPSLLETLDTIVLPPRDYDSPFKMSILDSYKDVNSYVLGRIDCGKIKNGDSLVAMPSKLNVEVQGISTETGTELTEARAGDSIRIRINGDSVDESTVRGGMVLCSPNDIVPVASSFIARIFLLEHDNVVTNGYTSVLHIHSATVNCTIQKILASIDKKTNKIDKKLPAFIRPGDSAIVRFVLPQPICVDTFEHAPRFGRFLFRHDGRTQGIGVVKKVETE